MTSCMTSLFLRGLVPEAKKLQTLFDLSFERFTELGGWVLREAVHTCGDSALVGQIAGNTTLVLLGGATDEGRVEDETILGSLSLGLQGSEEGLLSTENLDGGGGELGEGSEGASGSVG